MAGLDSVADLFDELVINADVGEFATEGSTEGTESHPQPGHPENQANQHPQKDNTGTDHDPFAVGIVLQGIYRVLSLFIAAL